MTACFDVTARLITLFAGRRDAFNTHRGGGYLTVRQPLTPEVILAALDEDRPVGGYFLSSDSMGHVAALDFDRPDGIQLACRVGTVAWDAKVPAYAEPSRGGRAHLWFSVEEPLPGTVLRRALRVLLADARVVAMDADLSAAHIELRPAQDRLSSPDSLGTGLRLATMPHPATRKRYPLCDPRTGTPLGQGLGAMLGAIRPAPLDRVQALAGLFKPPAAPIVPRRPRSWSGGESPIARFNRTTGISAVLIRDWGVERAAPGRTVRCPAHDDRSPSLSIARDDLRAWCHSPGCPFEAGGRGVDPYDAARLDGRTAP